MEAVIRTSIGVVGSLRRAWITIALLGLLGMAAGVATAFAMPSRYDSSADVFFSVRAGASLNELSQGNQFVESRLRSYASVVTSPLVLEPVIDELDLDLTVDELAEQVTAEPQLDTVLMSITATAATPDEAAAIASAVVTSLDAAVAQLEDSAGSETQAGPDVAMTVTRAAAVPASAAGPGILVLGALGALLGLAVGAVVAVVRGRVDDTVRGASDVALALPGVASLGALPRGEDDPEAALEARTLLLAAAHDLERRSVLVTSSSAGEGRTTAAIQLARSIAGMGRRVCLVDADLRRPAIADRLGIDTGEGLAGVVVGGANLATAIRTVDSEALTVLPAGIASAPADLLASPETERLLRRLEVHWDIVIVDAPALGDGPDATILAENVGGVVLVTRTGVATRRGLAAAAARLRAVRATLLGAVLVGTRARAAAR